MFWSIGPAWVNHELCICLIGDLPLHRCRSMETGPALKKYKHGEYGLWREE